MLGEANDDRIARRRRGTRQEIIEAAWAVVRELGWSGLTQRAVAERVSVMEKGRFVHEAGTPAFRRDRQTAKRLLGVG